MKKNISLILSFFLMLVLSSCGTQQIAITSPEETGVVEQTQTTEQETITVTSSIIPIGSVINAVG